MYRRTIQTWFWVLELLYPTGYLSRSNRCDPRPFFPHRGAVSAFSVRCHPSLPPSISLPFPFIAPRFAAAWGGLSRAGQPCCFEMSSSAGPVVRFFESICLGSGLGEKKKGMA